jgi:hypothetical protein
MKKKISKIKQRWKGIFNYSRELLILYCYAYTELQAREVFFNRLARKHGVSVYTVRQKFMEDVDNFKITLETEMREL